MLSVVFHRQDIQTEIGAHILAVSHAELHLPAPRKTGGGGGRFCSPLIFFVDMSNKLIAWFLRTFQCQHENERRVF